MIRIATEETDNNTKTFLYCIPTAFPIKHSEIKCTNKAICLRRSSFLFISFSFIVLQEYSRTQLHFLLELEVCFPPHLKNLISCLIDVNRTTLQGKLRKFFVQGTKCLSTSERKYSCLLTAKLLGSYQGPNEQQGSLNANI